MPYKITNDTFNELLKRAIQTKEIRDEMERVEITQELLETNVRKKKQEIWDAGAREIAVLNQLEKQLVLKRLEMSEVEEALELHVKELKLIYPRLDPSNKFPYQDFPLSALNDGIFSLRTWLRRSLTILFLIFIIGMISLFAVIYFLPLILASIIIVLSFCLLGWVFYDKKKKLARSKVKFDKGKEEYGLAKARYEQKKTELGIEALETSIVEAKKEVEKAVLINGILPELRLVINAQLDLSYATSLPLLAAPGLAEVFNPTHEIPTESKNNLLRLLENMPGGSIGIAGPRGVGKTTLLQSLCVSPNLEIQMRPVLSVMIPAPVEYDARDFTLHIFSAVCLRVLKLNDVTPSTPWESMNEMHSSSIEHNPGRYLLGLLSVKSILLSALVSFIIGVILIGASIYIATLSLASTSTPIHATSTPIHATSTPVAATSTPVAATSTPIHATSTPTWCTGWPTWCPSIPIWYTNTKNTLSVYLPVLEIKPGSFLSWGLLLVILGCIGGAAGQSSRRNLKKEMEKEEEKRIEEENQRIKEEKRQKRVFDAYMSNTLVGEAQRWLAKIRFQQSYSSGWSGTLKLPVALEATENVAVSLAQNQLSLPEIIASYRDFISLVSREYQTIICIDEMDKLESDEKAQRFLNETKALFNLEHCFYLISVSENAMSSFERRGLPFRDVFDSSFDDIININYLNFDSAQRLLKRRVIGIPMPFLCLCYCISGGLPRDLIRTCRELFGQVQQVPHKNNLEQLCKFLIAKDVKAKLNAAIIASKNTGLETEMNRFYETLHQLEISSLALKNIANLLDDTQQGATTRRGTAQSNESQVATEQQKQAEELRTGLGTYLYYAVTILEYFASKRNIAGWKDVESKGDYEWLARARQLFGVSPRLAYEAISNFRREQHMDIL
jgi:hypothetical protein